jgi:hypothetical protein
MKMLLLSPMLVTQSLTEKTVLLTLANKRLKCGTFRSHRARSLNRMLSKKACLLSFPAPAGLKVADQEA